MKNSKLVKSIAIVMIAALLGAALGVLLVESGYCAWSAGMYARFLAAISPTTAAIYVGVVSGVLALVYVSFGDTN